MTVIDVATAARELEKSSPLEMGLDWAVHLDKPGYFVGRRALEKERREGSAWKLMGFEVDWEGMEKLFAAAGLPPGLAEKLARETVAGSGELLHRSGEKAAVLRENVCSSFSDVDGA